MTAFTKIALILFASLGHSSAVEDPKEVASASGTTRDLLWVPNCARKKHKRKPVCKCRYPQNWDKWICRGERWWEKEAVLANINKMSRIVGGEEVSAGTYPWFARGTLGGDGWQGCGGSLVTPEYVLTAAHCIFDSFESNGGYQIGALCPDYTQGNNCGQDVEAFDVRTIYNHPSYNNANSANDFALVRLSGSSTIAPIAMDQGNFSPSYGSNKRLWPAGFGSLYSGGPVANNLLHVEVNYVTQDACKEAYGSNAIKPNMLCAASNGKDSCQGDSGGPLIDRDNNVLVGVVSWGYGCAAPDYPGVYSRISDQWSWIKTTVCSNHNDPKPDFCGGGGGGSGAPTPAPAGGDCTGYSVVVFVRTDSWPYESSWSITDSSGTSVAAKDYTGAEVNSDFSESVCLPANSCYTFTISDSYGDGLADGSSYSVTVDGSPVPGLGDAFTDSDSEQFGACGTTDAPTASPVSFPTSPFPTVSPVGQPPSGDCAAGESTVKVMITTDEYAEETSWEISNSDGTIISSRAEYPAKFQAYVDTVCVPNDECLWFELYDSYGDGFSEGGMYEIEVDGVTQHSGSGFSSYVMREIGTCECEAGTKKVEVGIRSDQWGEENRFKIKRRTTQKKWRGNFFEINGFPSDADFLVSTCLPDDQCYKFFLFDTFSDGIVGDDIYDVSWDGEYVVEVGTFEDGRKKKSSRAFGNCPSD